jgi:broad specificity phosphatase PhoE
MDHYFLRHFQTNLDPKKPVSKWELSEDGKKDLEQFINNLVDLPFKIILTSPEFKTQVIAKAINKKYAIPYKELEILKELDRDNAGYIKNDYKSTVKEFFEGNLNPEIQWETRKSLQNRISRFLVILKNETESVLVIGHGLFLTQMLAPVLNQKYFDFWSSLKFGELLEISKEQLINKYGI